MFLFGCLDTCSPVQPKWAALRYPYVKKKKKTVVVNRQKQRSNINLSCWSSWLQQISTLSSQLGAKSLLGLGGHSICCKGPMPWEEDDVKLKLMLNLTSKQDGNTRILGRTFIEIYHFSTLACGHLHGKYLPKFMAQKAIHQVTGCKLSAVCSFATHETTGIVGLFLLFVFPGFICFCWVSEMTRMFKSETTSVCTISIQTSCLVVFLHHGTRHVKGAHVGVVLVLKRHDLAECHLWVTSTTTQTTKALDSRGVLMCVSTPVVLRKHGNQSCKPLQTKPFQLFWCGSTSFDQTDQNQRFAKLLLYKIPQKKKKYIYIYIYIKNKKNPH